MLSKKKKKILYLLKINIKINFLKGFNSLKDLCLHKVQKFYKQYMFYLLRSIHFKYTFSLKRNY